MIPRKTTFEIMSWIRELSQTLVGRKSKPREISAWKLFTAHVMVIVYVSPVPFWHFAEVVEMVYSSGSWSAWLCM